jgi:hypothetical protein
MGHDIDKLLGDEPDEQEDVENGEGADQDPSAGEKPKEGEQPKPLTPEEADALRKENARLRNATKTLNRKLREKVEPKPDAPEDKPDYQSMSPAQLREISKTDPGAKAWLDLIKEETTQAMKPLRDTAYRTAVKQFADKHPEYLSTAEGRARFKAVEATAKRNGLENALDAGSMLDLLNRAHAYENPDQPAKPDPGRERAKKFAAGQAAPPASEKPEGGEFTEEEMAHAEKMGCTPEEARAAMNVYGNSRVDLT